MMIIFVILFKITPPSHQKKINSNFLSCGEHEPFTRVDGSLNEHYLVNCENGNTPTTIHNSVFRNYKVHYSSIGKWSHFMLFLKSDATIKFCEFDDCHSQQEIIKTEGKTDNHLYFYTNSLNNCYQENKEDHNVIYSEYSYNDIQNNSITFDQNLNHNCRAFYIYKNRGLKLYGNTVINGNNNQGSVLQTIDVGSNNLGKLEISYCTFTSCKGSKRLLLDIQKIDDDITITNMTVNYCSNNEYLFYFVPVDNGDKNNIKKTKINFINCKFSNIEANCNGGGGIGLLLAKDKNSERYNFELYFEGTVFEHIKSNHGSQGGGVFTISNDIAGNCRTELIIKKCFFNDVTSANGQGGAIYFKTFLSH